MPMSFDEFPIFKRFIVLDLIFQVAAVNFQGCFRTRKGPNARRSTKQRHLEFRSFDLYCSILDVSETRGQPRPQIEHI